MFIVAKEYSQITNILGSSQPQQEPLYAHTEAAGLERSSFLALAIFSLVACAAVSLISRDEPAPSL